MIFNATQILALAGAFCGWTVTIATFAWWLSNQFHERDEKLAHVIGVLDRRLAIVETKQEALDHLRGNHVNG